MNTESIKVELPADRLYKEDCYCTTLTLSDASSLSLLPKTKDTKKVFSIIDNHLNLNVKKLTLPDFWFLLYWQRINSYPSFPIKLPWECPHCNTKNVDELTGSKLVIKDLPEEYYAETTDDGIEVDFPSTGPLFIRVKLAGDELEVQNYFRSTGVTPTPELYEELLMACMLSPNGQTLEERHKLLKTMSADDHMVLEAFEDMFDFGVQPYSEFTCHECKEVSKVTFEFNLTNFFPSVSNSQDLRARILPRKGVKSAPVTDPSNGSSESSIHTEDSRELHKNVKTNEGFSKIEGEEIVTYTQEELEEMLAKVRGGGASEKEIDFDQLGDR